jgi:excisionase family DNA binding protein
MSSEVMASSGRREWMSIAELAKELGMSQMTLYRVIAAGEFPAVRIGRRLFVPTRVLDQLAESALASGRLVSAAEWKEMQE